MPRTSYRNGEPISLESCGCDGCNPTRINGTLCHESGCPYAWKDYSRSCFECGCQFNPESRHQEICDGCANPDSCDEYPCESDDSDDDSDSD